MSFLLISLIIILRIGSNYASSLGSWQISSKQLPDGNAYFAIGSYNNNIYVIGMSVITITFIFYVFISVYILYY